MGVPAGPSPSTDSRIRRACTGCRHCAAGRRAILVLSTDCTLDTVDSQDATDAPREAPRGSVDSPGTPRARAWQRKSQSRTHARVRGRDGACRFHGVPPPAAVCLHVRTPDGRPLTESFV